MAIALRDTRILITGGTGFLGRHLAQSLRKRGVPDDQIFMPLHAEYDLRRPENCEKVVQGCGVVIHLAAVTGNGEFHKAHPGDIFYDNITMGVELLEASRRFGVQKFVGIGSATEYPEHAELPFEESHLWDGYTEPLHAPYSYAKKALLVGGQAYHDQYKFPAIHLLLSNMYGPGEDSESGYVIPSLIKRILEAKKREDAVLEVWGTGTPTREFLYVEDAAEAILKAAELYDKPEPINIGSGEEIAIRDLVALLADLLHFKGEIRWDISKPDGRMRLALDVGKAEREFGFKATTSLRSGLEKTIAAFQK